MYVHVIYHVLTTVIHKVVFFTYIFMVVDALLSQRYNSQESHTDPYILFSMWLVSTLFRSVWVSCMRSWRTSLLKKLKAPCYLFFRKIIIK